jgi:hypothetical protein
MGKIRWALRRCFWKKEMGTRLLAAQGIVASHMRYDANQKQVALGVLFNKSLC